MADNAGPSRPSSLSGPARAGGGATENILTSKLGPLPVWAWGAGAVIGALLIFKLMGGRATGTAAQQAAAAGAAYPGSQAPGGSPTMGGTPVYVYSQPGDNAQTGGPGGARVGNLGPGPTTPLAVGASGTSSVGVSSSTTGINAGTAGGAPAGGGLIAFDPNGSQIPVWGLDQAHQGIIGYVNSGTNMGTNVVPRIGFNGDHGWQVQYGGVPGWIASQFTQQQPGQTLGAGAGPNVNAARGQATAIAAGGRGYQGQGRGPRLIPVGNGLVNAPGIGSGSGRSSGNGRAHAGHSASRGAVRIHRGI